MSVASPSLSVCYFTQIVVLSPGCSIFSSRFSIGSITFGFVRSSFLNCTEKKGKFGLAESSVKVVYQVNVDLLSTNRKMHIGVRLIHVNPVNP